MTNERADDKSDEQRCAANTDRELYREIPGDYYAPSIHVTQGGGIGINVGGSVYVMPLRSWHRLAGGPMGIRMDRDWWRSQGIEACLDRMQIMGDQLSAPSATAPTEAWRSAVTLARLTPEKVGELWKSAMFESAANFRGYLDQGRLPSFGNGGEATLPERFVIKLVDHLLSTTDGKAKD